MAASDDAMTTWYLPNFVTNINIMYRLRNTGWDLIPSGGAVGDQMTF